MLINEGSWYVGWLWGAQQVSSPLGNQEGQSIEENTLCQGHRAGELHYGPGGLGVLPWGPGMLERWTRVADEGSFLSIRNEETEMKWCIDPEMSEWEPGVLVNPAWAPEGHKPCLLVQQNSTLVNISAKGRLEEPTSLVSQSSSPNGKTQWLEWLTACSNDSVIT